MPELEGPHTQVPSYPLIGALSLVTVPPFCDFSVLSVLNPLHSWYKTPHNQLLVNTPFKYKAMNIQHNTEMLKRKKLDKNSDLVKTRCLIPEEIKRCADKIQTI